MTQALSQFTPKQQKYLSLVIQGVPPKKACLDAGYRLQSFQKLEQNPKLNYVIRKIQQSSYHAALISRERILAEHAKIAFNEPDKPITDKDGNDVGYDVASRQKSLDSLSRMLGYDAPKKIEVGTAGEFAALSDKELQDRINDLRQANEQTIIEADFEDVT